MNVPMHNRLPQDIVDLPPVSSFQKKLTRIVKDRAEQRHANWRYSFKNVKDVIDYFYLCVGRKSLHVRVDVAAL